jgi:hypothetical protein
MMSEKKGQLTGTVASESEETFSSSSNEIQSSDSTTCPGEFIGQKGLSQLGDSNVITKEECVMSHSGTPSNTTKKRGRLSQAEIIAERDKFIEMLNNGLSPLEAQIRLGIPEKRVGKHLLSYHSSQEYDHISCLCRDIPMVITSLHGGQFTDDTGFIVELSEGKIILNVIEPDK